MVDHINLGNRRIEIVSDEDAEKAAFVVCATTLPTSREGIH